LSWLPLLLDCRRCAAGDDHGYLPLHQVACQIQQSVVAAFRPAIFDHYVAAFNITRLLQALMKRP
jgi:hypothetical protein